MESLLNLIPILIIISIGFIIQISANRKAKWTISQFISDIQGELIVSEWTMSGELRWAYWGKMFRSDYIFAFKVKDKLYNGLLISWLGNHKAEWQLDGKWMEDPIKFIKRKK